MCMTEKLPGAKMVAQYKRIWQQNDTDERYGWPQIKLQNPTFTRSDDDAVLKHVGAFVDC